MKFKVCGMKHNISEVAALGPDYLGFIFYDGSPRNFDGEILEIPTKIKKVGVFVDAEMDFVLDKVKQHGLDILQLHGSETPKYCENLKEETELEIWKVFSVKDSFNFNRLKPYKNIVDAFLFDTKGEEKGGTGKTFDWGILKKYPFQKPIILSGGIGLEQLDALRELFKMNLPIIAVDVNSRFEERPGKKQIGKLREFIEHMND